MADISKITLPSGNTYDIKDATAREMISGGISFIVAWDGTGTAVAENIPKGVVAGGVTGTLEAADAQAGAFYLVKSSSTPSSQTLDIYDEYVVIGSATKSWEKIGDTQLNLSDVVTGVSLTKQTDVVLGEATTFTNGTSAVTFGTPTKDTFVKSVTAETGKNLVTTTVPNVTGNTSVSIPNVTDNTSVSASKISSNSSVTANKSTWTFTMGSGNAAETLIIGGSNGSDVTATNTAYSDVTATNTTLGTNLSASKVTLGTAVTVATGATSDSGTGDAVVTGVTVGDSAQAITALPTATAAAQTITVGTNDKVTVLKNTTDINVTKGNA